MIRSIILLLFLIWLPVQAFAQRATETVMIAQVEITSAVTVKVSEMFIFAHSNLLFEELEIDPASEKAAVVRITGSPGQQLLMTLPESIQLKDNGNRLRLTNLQYAITEMSGSERMTSIETNECVILEIPGSGELYLRIGGVLISEYYIDMGDFSGTIPISVTCVD